jgi:hypothetical protein
VASGLVTLVAYGDVMPSCGIDQILPHPGGPEPREDWARDANAYVRLAADTAISVAIVPVGR